MINRMHDVFYASVCDLHNIIIMMTSLDVNLVPTNQIGKCDIIAFTVIFCLKFIFPYTALTERERTLKKKSCGLANENAIQFSFCRNKGDASALCTKSACRFSSTRRAQCGKLTNVFAFPHHPLAINGKKYVGTR